PLRLVPCPLSLHDALPIFGVHHRALGRAQSAPRAHLRVRPGVHGVPLQTDRLHDRPVHPVGSSANHHHSQLHPHCLVGLVEHLPRNSSPRLGQCIRNLPVPATLPHSAHLDPRSRST